MMKRLLILIAFFTLHLSSKAQIENVIVETYYISDSLDATDTTDGRFIEVGSTTYRIYVDLLPGSKIKNIFGNKYHHLKISSTANFYNNINRPNAWFGYLINKAWFYSNPTIALDSWFTLGLATKTHLGVPQSEDPDSSILGGIRNGGGSSSVPGGILVSTKAEIPVTIADGLVPNTASLLQWLDYGFRDNSNVDTTVFGSVKIGSIYSNGDSSVLLQQNALVGGANPDSNKVLIAQLTTKGKISFELNFEIQNADGSFTKYVANDDTLLANETVSPFLKYPPECGCKDPNFLEFRKSYRCSIQDSCKTRIVFGCLDSMACNFNPLANYNIQYLCCYPGYCNDRNLDIVCPSASSERVGVVELNLFPNPASNKISFLMNDKSESEVFYRIYNSFGKEEATQKITVVSGNNDVDISFLKPGLYFFRLFTDENVISTTFLKH